MLFVVSVTKWESGPHEWEQYCVCIINYNFITRKPSSCYTHNFQQPYLSLTCMLLPARPLFNARSLLISRRISASVFMSSGVWWLGLTNWWASFILWSLVKKKSILCIAVIDYPWFYGNSRDVLDHTCHATFLLWHVCVVLYGNCLLHLQEVFKSDFSDNVHPNKVLGKCYVMSVKEYFKNRPEVCTNN